MNALLFFLADLDEDLEKGGWEGNQGNRKIVALVYADDLVSIAKMRIG